MNEASVYLLKQNNGTKEIFSNNFFLSTFESYHPLRENDPYLDQLVTPSLSCIPIFTVTLYITMSTTIKSTDQEI